MNYLGNNAHFRTTLTFSSRIETKYAYAYFEYRSSRSQSHLGVGVKERTHTNINQSLTCQACQSESRLSSDTRVCACSSLIHLFLHQNLIHLSVGRLCLVLTSKFASTAKERERDVACFQTTFQQQNLHL